MMVSCSVQKNKLDMAKNLTGNWELQTLNGKAVQQAEPLSIAFSTDNEVYGFAGCNRLLGKYKMSSKGQIDLSQLGATRMACPESQMKIEDEYLEALKNARFTQIQNKILTLKDKNKKTLATFKNTNEAEIVNKYWKLVELDGQKVSMKENQEREQYFMLKSDGTVSGFAGCNYFNGTYTLKEGMRLKFEENMALTMKACPDIEENETEFLKVFTLADNYTIANDKLSLNVGRRAPLAVFKAIYFN